MFMYTCFSSIHPSVTAATSTESFDLSVATTVGISVSVTCVICFLTGVLVVMFIHVCNAKRMRKRPSSQGVAVYDEVGTNKLVKPVIMDMDKNSAYGLH